MLRKKKKTMKKGKSTEKPTHKIRHDHGNPDAQIYVKKDKRA